MALEEQLLAIVLELSGNLHPEHRESQSVMGVVLLVGLYPVVVLIAVGTRVVVYVDDTVETLVDHVVHHLVYTGHPFRLDACEFRLHVVVPGYGHADGAESGLLHHVDELACGLRLSPAGLRFQALLTPELVLRRIQYLLQVGVEGVTQVPSQSHVLDSVGSFFEFLRLQL